jgi:hypothetical protein
VRAERLSRILPRVDASIERRLSWRKLNPSIVTGAQSSLRTIALPFNSLCTCKQCGHKGLAKDFLDGQNVISPTPQQIVSVTQSQPQAPAKESLSGGPVGAVSGAGGGPGAVRGCASKPFTPVPKTAGGSGKEQVSSVPDQIEVKTAQPATEHMHRLPVIETVGEGKPVPAHAQNPVQEQAQAQPPSGQGWRLMTLPRTQIQKWVRPTASGNYEVWGK